VGNAPVGRRTRIIRWTVVLLFAGFLALGLAAVGKRWSRPERGTEPEAGSRPAEPDDPRRTAATRYQNVRPEVQYVGDAVCAECHRDIAESYRKHPMGRSLVPLAAALSGPEAPATPGSFNAAGFRYQVERQGGRLVHREQALDSQGQVLTTQEAPMDFAFGSGRRGRSYLFDRNGYLFESPITWYALRQSWDLSPGYQRANLHFSRPVIATCLFCHCNQVEPVEHSANHYREPLFRGHAIGCERCHGPGELHARRRAGGEAVTSIDETIVNPRHLEHALREAVCQQCHLQGEERVVPRGRQPFDYRPGLPLDRFLVDFVRPVERSGEQKFVGTVEQMHASRCYRESTGPTKLGCISCHDPHILPAEDRKAAYYRERCQACHRDRGCSLHVERRLKENADNCIACHMPRIASDISHTAISDHHIPRRPRCAPADAPPWPRPGQVALVPFFREHADDVEMSRDLAVALLQLAEKQPTAIARDLAATALPLLEAALRRHADDSPAWEARGNALWFVGNPEEALAAYEAGLAAAPRRETTLFPAATLAARLKHRDLAASLCRRALAVNPWRWEFHQLQAGLDAQAGRWPDAASECRRTLELYPADLTTRRLLVTSFVRSGDGVHARSEFDLLLRMTPTAQQPALRQAFSGLLP
jgi:hypothetical protein